MRLLLTLLAAAAFVHEAFGGRVQDAFRELVRGATEVRIERVRDHAVVLRSSDPKDVQRVAGAIELIDPVVERTPDGDEIITLTCFCVAEYTVSFTTAAATRVFYIKHSIGAVLGAKELGLAAASDLKLTKRSMKHLRRVIHQAESRPPNQSLEPTPHTGR